MPKFTTGVANFSNRYTIHKTHENIDFFLCFIDDFGALNLENR